MRKNFLERYNTMKKFRDYWNPICEVYFLTKHYLLLGEELSEDFDTFLQPVKEHRDAFDHIVRVYGSGFSKDLPKNLDAYRESNMQKALGHVYRAFFDAADYLSYICRKKIRLLLEGIEPAEIEKRYPNYRNTKTMLSNVAREIAQIRGNKDVNTNGDEIIGEVRHYQEILDRLIKEYEAIYEEFG